VSDLVDVATLQAVAARLELRDPNARAVESLAAELAQWFEVDKKPPPFEGVIDSATGVGKTYILAGALEYLSVQGIRNFVVITPGRTILEKTVANFTAGHAKSLLGGMDTQPVVITAENFNSPSMRRAMDDPSKVKLYVFSVQSLTKPTTKAGRRTHRFQEGLGRAFYEHLDAQGDLIVFADEHHAYFGPSFSAAVRDLTPYALVGLTATPHRQTPEDQIIFRYPLAAAIADRLVKTPVLVGRKDDRSDPETKLLDGVRLLEAKMDAMLRYCQETGRAPVNPVMLVIAQSIDDAETYSELLESQAFAGGRYTGAVLVVHSRKPDEDLAKLQAVEEDESPIRIIVSVGMLKEGWDVKNVYVIASMRSSVSQILTEQTLGRGLRLPFGEYTEWELLDTLEVLAHERYEELLRKARVINEAFVDHRSRAVIRRNAKGAEVSVLEREPVALAMIEPENDPETVGAPSLAAAPRLQSLDERNSEVIREAAVPELRGQEEFPALYMPTLKMAALANPFALADITDYQPFREAGQRLARDPAGELRRIRLSAQVVEGLDGFRHTQLAPARTVDHLESPATLIPINEIRDRLADRILAAPVVPARKGQRAQLEPILDSFMEGLEDEAEAILSSYMDRAAARLIQIITEEHRRFVASPTFEETVELVPFSPVRHGKAMTTQDRFGPFKRGVGYEGWSRSLFSQNWFDSSTERDFANLVDAAESVGVWVRLLPKDLPIRWDSGVYNPDFLVAEGDVRWIVETKADRDVATDAVVAKKEAARRWANHVTASDTVKKQGNEWRYLMVSETELLQAKDDWGSLAASASA
jgi:type III restriction enzyme